MLMHVDACKDSHIFLTSLDVAALCRLTLFPGGEAIEAWTSGASMPSPGQHVLARAHLEGRLGTGHLRDRRLRHDHARRPAHVEDLAPWALVRGAWTKSGPQKNRVISI